MDDLIRRSDVKDKLKECLKKASPPLMYPDWNDAVLAVMTAPAVDAVEVRHGRWKRVDYEMVGHDYVCSECGEKNDRASRWCPDCGARMDGEDGDA